MDKNESHSTIKKAKFVHFVLFVKKGPCYIGNFGQNFGNHILFLKKVDRIPWFWPEKTNLVIWEADGEAILRPPCGKIGSTWWGE